jgi:hypothetical protein
VSDLLLKIDGEIRSLSSSAKGFHQRDVAVGLSFCV